MKIKFLPAMALISLALFLSGCQTTSLYSQSGSVAPEDRVSISPGQNAGTWQGRDLSVDYKYSRGEGGMDLSGIVLFADYMTYGYSFLRDFRLSAVFLDENGRVLEARFLAATQGAIVPVPFHTGMMLPSGAVAMSFSYDGTAIESVGRGGGNPTRFWYGPIH
jgi:hypothetical protein